MFKQLVRISGSISKAHTWSRCALNLSNSATPSVVYQPKRFYTKEGLVFRNERQGYFQDPNEIARRLVKLIASHDTVKNPEKITLDSTFYEIGVDEFSYVEIMLEAENEFYLEFADDDLEKFTTVREAVEFISRSFYSQ